MSDDTCVLFTSFLLYFCFLPIIRKRRQQKGHEELKAVTGTAGVRNAHSSTHYLDYPIFSICRGTHSANGNTKEELYVTSGGGGGADYGVADRLELYRIRGQEVDLISSQLVLGVIDGIQYNAQKKLFIGGQNKDCVIFRYNPVSSSLEIIYRWTTVPQDTAQRGRGFIAGQERCAINPEGTIVSVAGEDRILRVYTVHYDSSDLVVDVALKREFPALHQASVTDMAFSPDGNLLLTASRDGYVCVIGPFLSESGSSSSRELDILARLTPPSNKLDPNEASNPKKTLLPRNIRWAPSPLSSTALTSCPTRASYPLVLSSYTVSGMSTLHQIDLHASIPRIEDHAEAVVTWHEKSRVTEHHCAMFNSFSLSDDGSLIAAVSNTTLYVYQLTDTLARLFQCPRTADPSGSDLPSTGCIITNTNDTVVLSAGDFGLTCVNLAAAKAHSSSWRKLYVPIAALWCTFRTIVCAAVWAIALSGFRQGFLEGGRLHPSPPPPVGTIFPSSQRWSLMDPIIPSESREQPESFARRPQISHGMKSLKTLEHSQGTAQRDKRNPTSYHQFASPQTDDNLNNDASQSAYSGSYHSRSRRNPESNRDEL